MSLSKKQYDSDKLAPRYDSLPEFRILYLYFSKLFLNTVLRLLHNSSSVLHIINLETEDFRQLFRPCCLFFPPHLVSIADGWIKQSDRNKQQTEGAFWKITCQNEAIIGTQCIELEM